jgi:hypothetical protein
MSSEAKLAYLLSTCHKFSDAFFAAMGDHHPTVAMRRCMLLRITLAEPHGGPFAVAALDVAMAHDSNTAVSAALQSYNKSILSNATLADIRRASAPINPLGLFCVAALAKNYLTEKKDIKYVMVPVIVDYGRDKRMVHQAAIIVMRDPSASGLCVLFYEPYGAYEKYKKSYSDVVCRLLRAIAPTQTFHDAIGAPDGIQSIILKQNNMRGETFAAAYTVIKARLADKGITFSVVAGDGQDKTMCILRALFYAQHYLNPKIPDDADLLHDILNMYCCYNSKTCVSITLVELNAFFAGRNLLAMHDEYRVERPNIVLMNELMLLLGVMPPRMIDIVKKHATTTIICEKLFEA